MVCLSSVLGSTACCFDRSYLKFNPISVVSSATVAPHHPFVCSLPFRGTIYFRRVLPAAAAATVTAEPATVLSAAPKKVLIPLGYGTEETEAVILVHALRRAGAQVIVASVEPQLQVEASSGLKLVADTLISSCEDETFDLIALPGGMPGSARLRDSEVLRKITSKHAEYKKLYGAICAAPAVTLLPWGLLKKKRCTCHPAFKDKLPPFWAVKSNVQVSGELTTSRGPGTTYEFALSLVEQLFGESVAKDVKESLLLNTEDHLRKEEFNEGHWLFDQIPNVLIPVANGSEEIDIVTIVDILRRAKANVVVASVEKSLQILASQGTKITADKYIAAAAESKYDLIVLPGGLKGSIKLGKSRILKKLLKEQDLAGRICGEICSASSLLQKQGLLKDKTVAAHSSISDKLASKVVDNVKVVIDGNLITSKGLASSMDFALAIVAKLFGNARARSVAEGLVFEFPRS